jgi:uncharacterized membrane protein
MNFQDSIAAAWAKIGELINGFIVMLPNIVLAAIVFIAFFFAARWLKMLVKRLTRRHRQARNLGMVLGRLAQGIVILIGLFVALSIVIPTFRAGDLVQLLGISGVAIGFAFRDILQNFLAGILILLTEPFQIDDQIVFNNFEGTVENIETRATTIRTYDGRRIVIPNSQLFTNSVTVNTAFENRRIEYDVGIGYGDDLEEAKRLMLEAIYSIVLGTFIGTFIYSLLVLRTIRGDGDDFDKFVPQLSVTVGLLLAIASIGVLIYFIHHASTIIQVSHVISETSKELDSAIDRLFPEKIGQALSQPKRGIEDIPANFDSNVYRVKSKSDGYLQAIDDRELMKLACKHDLILRLNYRPGKFVIKGSESIVIYPRERVTRKLVKKLDDVFILGRKRTEQQDVEFPIEQLVEIALRALSPSLNDPFTAIRCIDRLSAGLSRLAQRDFPSSYRYDKGGNLRIIAERVTFSGLIDAAFNQIRQNGKSDVAVTIRLLEAISTIAGYTQNQKDRAILLRHAEMIQRDSYEAISEELDKKDIEELYLGVKRALLANDCC